MQFMQKTISKEDKVLNVKDISVAQNFQKHPKKELVVVQVALQNTRNRHLIRCFLYFRFIISENDLILLLKCQSFSAFKNFKSFDFR